MTPIEYSFAADEGPENLRRSESARRENAPSKRRQAFAKRKSNPTFKGVHRRKNRRYHL